MSASPSSFSSPLSSSILFIKHQNITPHIFEYPVALLYPSQVIQRNTAGSEYQVHCAPAQQQQQQLLCAPAVAQSQWGPPSKRQKQSQPQPIFNCLSLNFRDRNQPHCVGGWCHPVVQRWSANLVRQRFWVQKNGFICLILLLSIALFARFHHSLSNTRLLSITCSQSITCSYNLLLYLTLKQSFPHIHCLLITRSQSVLSLIALNQSAGFCHGHPAKLFWPNNLAFGLFQNNGCWWCFWCWCWCCFSCQCCGWWRCWCSRFWNVHDNKSLPPRFWCIFW